MLARLGAKAVFAVFALALVFFATGLLVQAIAEGFASLVGPAWGDAITAGILLVPALLWALVVSLSRRPPQPRSSNGILRALFAAIAKDTPWVAVIGAGLAGAAEVFFSRNKPRR